MRVFRCSESNARETVMSAHICSRDVLEGGARSSRGVTCDWAFCAFYIAVERILKQAFKANFTCILGKPIG